MNVIYKKDNMGLDILDTDNKNHYEKTNNNYANTISINIEPPIEDLKQTIGDNDKDNIINLDLNTSCNNDSSNYSIYSNNDTDNNKINNNSNISFHINRIIEDNNNNNALITNEKYRKNNTNNKSSKRKRMSSSISKVKANDSDNHVILSQTVPGILHYII